MVGRYFAQMYENIFEMRDSNSRLNKFLMFFKKRFNVSYLKKHYFCHENFFINLNPL